MCQLGAKRVKRKIKIMIKIEIKTFSFPALCYQLSLFFQLSAGSSIFKQIESLAVELNGKGGPYLFNIAPLRISQEALFSRAHSRINRNEECIQA
jgi:hypothetical protein